MIDIAFRKLEKRDLELLYTWLCNEEIYKWYGKSKRTYEDIERKYLPRIEGQVPTKPYLIIFDRNPIGYIQTYKLSDYPDYAKCLGLDFDAACIDVFLGDVKNMGKGYSRLILRKFLEKVVFKIFSLDNAIIAPEINNLRAISAYESAGFIYIKTAVSDNGDYEYIMAIERKDVTYD